METPNTTTCKSCNGHPMLKRGKLKNGSDRLQLCFTCNGTGLAKPRCHKPYDAPAETQEKLRTLERRTLAEQARALGVAV